MKRTLRAVVFARDALTDTLTLTLARHDSSLTDPAFAGSVSPYPRPGPTPSGQILQPLLLRH